MTRVLFVCHGNICRSPMAEFVFRHLAEAAGLSHRVTAASAGTSGEETGNPVHPGTRRKLAEMGISCAGKTAARLRPEDYHRYERLVGMDQHNLRNMVRLFGGDPAGKVSLLLDWAGRPGQSIADPWYTGDFDRTYADVLTGCQGLLEELGHGCD